jgi:hypothetical protein
MAKRYQRGNQNLYIAERRCLSFCHIQILITHLVSFDHCIVCLSVIYGFWLPFWYLLVIVLSVFLRFTDSDYPFGIFWPLLCLSFYDLQILITLLVSSNSSYSINLKLFPRKNINFIYSWHDIDDNNSMTFWWIERQTTQWTKDTKRVIRIRKSQKDRQYNGQKIPNG